MEPAWGAARRIANPGWLVAPLRCVRRDLQEIGLGELGSTALHGDGKKASLRT
jgi:hypothetical protein